MRVVAVKNGCGCESKVQTGLVKHAKPENGYYPKRDRLGSKGEGEEWSPYSKNKRDFLGCGSSTPQKYVGEPGMWGWIRVRVLRTKAKKVDNKRAPMARAEDLLHSTVACSADRHYTKGTGWMQTRKEGKPRVKRYRSSNVGVKACNCRSHIFTPKH